MRTKRNTKRTINGALLRIRNGKKVQYSTDELIEMAEHLGLKLGDLASEWGAIDLVKELVDREPNLVYPQFFTEQALVLAARSQYYEVVVYLYQNLLDLVNPNSMKKAIEEAAKAMDHDTLEFLALRAGPFIDLYPILIDCVSSDSFISTEVLNKITEYKYLDDIFETAIKKKNWMTIKWFCERWPDHCDQKKVEKVRKTIPDFEE